MRQIGFVFTVRCDWAFTPPKGVNWVCFDKYDWIPMAQVTGWIGLFFSVFCPLSSISCILRLLFCYILYENNGDESTEIIFFYDFSTKPLRRERNQIPNIKDQRLTIYSCRMVVGDLAYFFPLYFFAVDMTVRRMVIDAQHVLASRKCACPAGRRRS